jgi:stress-induced morphogen
MKEKITLIINANLENKFQILVEDTSQKHAGHGHLFQKESHFEVLIFADNLPILEKISIQKKLTQALSHLYAKNLVHSISITFK